MKIRLLQATKIALSLLPFLSIICEAQETRIRFFGQPGVDQTYNPKADQSSVYFRGGPMIFYITSQINEKISVAAELNPHYNSKEGPQIEIERIFAKYYVNDNLSFKIGRMYNPLGYWNANYNWGMVLQPTINRPQILQPLHDEGFTQTRDAGVQIEGNEIGSARFFYRFMVGNGIGKYGGTGGVPYKLGQDPGYTACVGIEPVDGLKFLISGYYDNMLKGMVTNFGDSLPNNIGYTVGSASIVYLNPEKKGEFIAEYFAHNYTYDSIGTKTTHAAYVYGGYKLSEKVIPYIYAEMTIFDKNNPIFDTPRKTIQLETTKSLSLGTRYRFDPNAVIKFEYELRYGDVSEFSFGPRIQFAFGF